MFRYNILANKKLKKNLKTPKLPSKIQPKKSEKECSNNYVENKKYLDTLDLQIQMFKTSKLRNYPLKAT